MGDIRCALEVCKQYGIELTSEGSCYRADCPVCGQFHLTFAKSNRFDGYYFACPCYDQGGRNTGSGTNFDFWLRSLGARGQAQPVYLPTEYKPKSSKTLDASMVAKIVHGAMARLTPESAGAKYLQSRGIGMATAKAWRLGFGFWAKYENESIVIPWYSPEHTIIGVSHRLLAPTEGQPKAPWHSGMAGRTNGLLCGWHTHVSRSILIVVEGILNAPSLFQACGDVADILTPGSENTNPAQWDIERLHQWKQIVVWTDKEEKAIAWGNALDAKLCIYSQYDGQKVDANDMLKSGELRAFIEGSLQDESIIFSPSSHSCPTHNDGRWQYVESQATLRRDLDRSVESGDVEKQMYACALAAFLDGEHDDSGLAYQAAYTLGVQLCRGIQWGALNAR